MGRGQTATVHDQFSAIFGSRRGSGDMSLLGRVGRSNALEIRAGQFHEILRSEAYEPKAGAPNNQLVSVGILRSGPSRRFAALRLTSYSEKGTSHCIRTVFDEDADLDTVLSSAQAMLLELRGDRELFVRGARDQIDFTRWTYEQALKDAEKKR